MAKLTGKVAIVTGASRGIGKAIAELFAKEGAKVVCSARTLKEGEHPLLEGSLETTVAGIKKAGGVAEAVTCDVSSEADCEKLVAETHKLYGPVDVLVNNAALTYFIPVKDFPPKRWMRSFAVNLHGPFILSHLVLQDMVPRKSGCDRQHFVGRGDRTRPRTVQERDGVPRRRVLRRGEGRARALHARPRRRSL